MQSSGRSWSESSIHRWLFATHRPKGLAVKFGHDAATLTGNLTRPVLCIDQCIEGVHFACGTSGRLAGAKAAARALSDLAASAALPRALLFSASFPPETRESFIRAAIRAVADSARRFDCELVGGDLACARGPVVLSVAAVGEIGAGGRAPSRDLVRAGDIVLITGPVGGSQLGRHLRIQPRIADGRWLWQHGARAMTDLSDGLARDVARLASRSKLAIEIRHVPIHREARRAARSSACSALEHALFDGEDHERVLTLSPARARELLAKSSRRVPELFILGRARRGRGLFVPKTEGSEELVRVDPRRGWSHGTN